MICVYFRRFAIRTVTVIYACHKIFSYAYYFAHASRHAMMIDFHNKMLLILHFKISTRPADEFSRLRLPPLVSPHRLARLPLLPLPRPCCLCHLIDYCRLIHDCFHEHKISLLLAAPLCAILLPLRCCRFDIACHISAMLAVLALIGFSSPLLHFRRRHLPAVIWHASLPRYDTLSPR